MHRRNVHRSFLLWRSFEITFDHVFSLAGYFQCQQRRGEKTSSDLYILKMIQKLNLQNSGGRDFLRPGDKHAMRRVYFQVPAILRPKSPLLLVRHFFPRGFDCLPRSISDNSLNRDRHPWLLAWNLPSSLDFDSFSKCDRRKTRPGDFAGNGRDASWSFGHATFVEVYFVQIFYRRCSNYTIVI